MNINRKNWIDIAKAIAIILMVIGHTGYPDVLSTHLGIPHLIRNWIFSFHMPLFFLLSGALTNWNYSYTGFVIHKTKTLITYFFIYSIINILLLKVSGADFDERSFIHVLQYGWGGFALWFLAVLYLSLLFAKLFCEKYTIIATALLLTIAWALAHFDIQLPWALNAAPYATALLLIGKLSKNYLLQLPNLNQKQWIALTTTSLIICTTIAFFFKQDIRINQILPVIPILMGGGIRYIIHAPHFHQIQFLFTYQ